MSEAVYVKGLTKAYGGKTAVNALDLSVRSGTVFGLLSANGAGKTTTIKAVTGILSFDKGEILGGDVSGSLIKAEANE